MNTRPFSALLFDVDGTLYRPIPELSEDLNTYWIRQVAEYKRISFEKAAILFDDMKKDLKSSTLVLKKIGLGDVYSIIRRAEKHQLPILKNTIKPDRKLIRLIKSLRSVYELYTLRNGTRVGTRRTLTYLGFENKRQSHQKGFGPFDDILPTVELGLTKPEPLVFEKALRAIGKNPSEVAIIGDRHEIDLLPAHKLGMKTVWVSWGRTLDSYDGIDAVVETIYDCKDFLNN